MYLVISLIMAIAPSIILVCYFYNQDKKKPEPKGLVTKIFFLGLLFMVPTGILELFLDGFLTSVIRWPIFNNLFKAFFIAALCEEFVKLLIVKQFAYMSVHFDEVMDGIVYTIMASLGFACLENIIYVTDNILSIALTRSLTSVPMHAVVSGLMGYYIGKAKFSKTKKERKSLILKGLCLAVLIHGVYNLLLFESVQVGFHLALGVIPLLILTFISLREKIEIAIKEDVLAGRHS